MSERRQFWVVVDDDLDHLSLELDSEIEAKAEAEGYAKANPGQEFFVLCATHRCLAPEPGEITKELTP